jgi:hypothetical protein
MDMELLCWSFLLRLSICGKYKSFVCEKIHEERGGILLLLFLDFFSFRVYAIVFHPLHKITAWCGDTRRFGSRVATICTSADSGDGTAHITLGLGADRKYLDYSGGNLV